MSNAARSDSSWASETAGLGKNPRPAASQSLWTTFETGGKVVDIMDASKIGSEYFEMGNWLAWFENEAMALPWKSKTFASHARKFAEAAVSGEKPEPLSWEILRYSHKKYSAVLSEEGKDAVTIAEFAEKLQRRVSHIASAIYAKKKEEIERITQTSRLTANADPKNSDFRKIRDAWQTAGFRFSNLPKRASAEEGKSNPFVQLRTAAYALWETLPKLAEIAMKEDPSLRKTSLLHTPVSELVSSLLGRNPKK